MRGVVVAVLLGGCAIVPRVDYHSLADRPRADNWVPYALTDTTIAIGSSEAAAISLKPQNAECRPAGCDPPLAAVAVPIDFDGELLALAPRRKRFVTTSLSPSYYPDTLRLRVLNVEARDQSVAVIQTVGTIVTGIAGLAASGVRASLDDTATLRLLCGADVEGHTATVAIDKVAAALFGEVEAIRAAR